MIKRSCLLLLFLLFPLLLSAQISSTERRSFDSIFPDLQPAIREAAFASDGYIVSARATSIKQLVAASKNNLDSGITASALKNKSGYLAEALQVIPVNRNLLEIYNVLGNIRGLTGRLYNSHTHNKPIPLFEDATRIESEKKTTPVADPKPAATLPRSESIYIRLKDANFGNSYYRGDMTLTQHGLRYCLTNNRNLTYMLVPVIKEEKFSLQLYFEPIQEGILIYSIATADVSDFVASKISIPSAIEKRLEVIISWAVDGLSKK